MPDPVQSADGDEDIIQISRFSASCCRNPLEGAALTDDEIAVGDCMLRMAESVRTGKSFYPSREGMQDHSLYLRMQEALNTGTEVTTEPQRFSTFG